MKWAQEWKMEVRLEQLPKNRLPSAHTVILSHHNGMEGFNAFNLETSASSLGEVGLPCKHSGEQLGSQSCSDSEEEWTTLGYPNLKSTYHLSSLVLRKLVELLKFLFCEMHGLFISPLLILAEDVQCKVYPPFTPCYISSTMLHDLWVKCNPKFRISNVSQVKMMHLCKTELTDKLFMFIIQQRFESLSGYVLICMVSIFSLLKWVDGHIWCIVLKKKNKRMENEIWKLFLQWYCPMESNQNQHFA